LGKSKAELCSKLINKYQEISQKYQENNKEIHGKSIDIQDYSSTFPSAALKMHPKPQLRSDKASKEGLETGLLRS
jgi:hypothetical protein